MARAERADIKRRLGDLKALREPWVPLWRDVTAHVLPRRSFWDLNTTEGQVPDTKTYDGSPLVALQLLADWLQGNLVSPNMRWFRLRMQNRKLQDLPGVADWLEETEDVLYSEFARSNFYQSIAEYFTDSMSMGTASQFIEDDAAHRRILFSTRHLKECFIAEDRAGHVDTLYREYYMTNRATLQQWGDKIGSRRQDMADRDPFGKAHILHAVFPRDDRDYNKIDQLNQPFASRYIDLDFDHDIDEGGYKVFPYTVWRFRKNSDEVYGRSPAIDAINDILRLNQVSLTELMAGQLSVQPPLNVPESMRGYERIVPRGYNYFTNKDEIISPINLAQNYSIGKDIKEEIKATVKEHFRTTQLLLAEQAERQMTAREVIERQGEKALVLGVIMGGLNSETLIPTIDRVFDICDRNGLIPEAPRALQGGGIVDIEFMSPLAQAQKRFHQSQGIQAGFQFMLPTGHLFPRSLLNVDDDELMRIGLDASGMPQKIIREIPQRDAIRKAQDEAAAAAQKQAVALEQQKMMAGNVDKLNQPMKSDSMLAQLAAAQGAATPNRTGA